MTNRCIQVQFLVDKGANVNIKDKNGRTAIHHAAMNRYGNTRILALIRNGEDVNTADIHGRTAIFYAVSNNDKPMVEMLIDNGADTLKRDDQGKTALWYARMQEKTHPGITRALMLAGKQE
jgi:ankyrin repeat protein